MGEIMSIGFREFCSPFYTGLELYIWINIQVENTYIYGKIIVCVGGKCVHTLALITVLSLN